MGFRRSRARHDAARDWTIFVTNNAKVIRAATVPEAVVDTIKRWDLFLLRGCVDASPDQAGFSVDKLSETQYRALTQLVDSYFAVGYEYFTPLALRREDREVLDARYGPPGD